MGSDAESRSSGAEPHSNSSLHFGAGVDDLVEVFVRRRFAVAGEGDVVEAAEVGRDFAEFGRFVDLAGGDQVERRAEFVDEGGGFYEAGFALAAAVDLAVDAVEVADLVGVEIHADRDAAGAAAEDRVDEPVVLEEPGVIGVEGKGGQCAGTQDVGGG